MHHPRHRASAAPARRALGIAAAGIAALAALLAVAVLPAHAAQAAELPGAITSVTTDKTSYDYNERLALTFDWAVADSATAGDTFTLNLPDELEAVALAPFDLKDPDGDVVAHAVWSGKTVTFTLTDYADTHQDVHGSGFLTVQWDHSVTGDTGKPIDLQFDSNVVRVVMGDKPVSQPCTANCEPTVPTSRGLWKAGRWADGSYEGTRDPSGNIVWTVELPGDATGYPGPIDVVDTVGAGSVIDCDALTVSTQPSLKGGTPRTPVDPSRYTLSCVDGTFTLHLDAIAPSEFVTVDYTGTITDQATGSYSNHVDVTIAGVTTTKDSTITRADAGGVGDGDTPPAAPATVSVGDDVWLDADDDGLQGATEQGIPGVTLVLTGPDGGPVTDVHGAAVAPTVTDAQGHYLFADLPVLPAGQHYTVSIDQAASASALAGLLPTAAGTGSDRAVDSSTGSAESTDLTTDGASDLTLDFGFVRADLPTLSLPGDDEPTPAAATQLAHTGVDDAIPALAGALGLIVLGSVSALFAARRRRA